MQSLLLGVLLAVSNPPTPDPAPAAAAAPRDYVAEVHAALVAGVKPWTKAEGPRLRRLAQEGGVAALELGISATGSVTTLRLSLPSSRPEVDDALRRLVLEAEPLAAPPAELLGDRLEVPCLIRLALEKQGKKPTVAAAAVCERADGSLLAPQGASELTDAPDAAALFFAGLLAQHSGDGALAMEKLRAASSAAPTWPWAARALGLELVAAKKAQDAIPLLRVYVAARGGAADATGYAHEIARFDQQRAAREAEAKRVRERLSKQDIVDGVRKGYALLEPCLKAARASRLLAIGVDTLTLTFRIRKDGTTEAARLDGPRSLLVTDPAECLERAVGSWRFARYSAGSEVTVTHLPLRVKGSPAAPQVAAAGPATAAAQPPAEEALADEPTFSQCERTGTEVDAFLQSRLARIQACVASERRRTPKASMPERLPISFVIDREGPVRNVAVNHRYFRGGPLEQCITTALAGSLEAVEGADCPADFSVDLPRSGP